METNNDQKSPDNAGSSWSNNDSTSVCYETNTSIKIEAIYREDTIKFCLPFDPEFSNLKQKLATKFELELDSFAIKFLDDDQEWMLIYSDEDVKEAVDISLQSNRNILRLTVIDIEIVQTHDGSCENQLANKPSKRKAEEGDAALISSYEDLKQHFDKKLNDVQQSLELAGKRLRSIEVSMTSHKRDKFAEIDTNLTPHCAYNVDDVARQSEVEKVAIKIICAGHPKIIFQMRLKSKVKELEENVRSRLKLEPGILTMMYQDEDLDWVLIIFDADLQFGLETVLRLCEAKKWRKIVRINCKETK